MSFRKEKKYRVSLVHQKLLRDGLLARGMQPLHTGRRVNSCYFDSLWLNCFHDSEEGVLPRRKVRVRWYNNDNIFFKEIKISSIEGRFKKTEKINNFVLNRHDSTKFYDRELGMLRPITVVSYFREYFSFNGVRLTFDSHIDYAPLRNCGIRTLRDPQTVVEIKSPADISDDYISTVINLPTERFSKYCRAVLLTGLS